MFGRTNFLMDIVSYFSSPYRKKIKDVPKAIQFYWLQTACWLMRRIWKLKSILLIYRTADEITIDCLKRPKNPFVSTIFGRSIHQHWSRQPTFQWENYRKIFAPQNIIFKNFLVYSPEVRTARGNFGFKPGHFSRAWSRNSCRNT